MSFPSLQRRDESFCCEIATCGLRSHGPTASSKSQQLTGNGESEFPILRFSILGWLATEAQRYRGNQDWIDR